MSKGINQKILQRGDHFCGYCSKWKPAQVICKCWSHQRDAEFQPDYLNMKIWHQWNWAVFRYVRPNAQPIIARSTVDPSGGCGDGFSEWDASQDRAQTQKTSTRLWHYYEWISKFLFPPTDKLTANIKMGMNALELSSLGASHYVHVQFYLLKHNMLPSEICLPWRITHSLPPHIKPSKIGVSWYT